MSQPRKPKKRCRVGDVVAIPLSSGAFSFGRILNDECIAIYDLIRDRLTDVADLERVGVKFYTGLFKTSITSGEWPIICHITPAEESDEWAPPFYIPDVINENNIRIYHRGRIRKARPEEIVGLERQCLWYPVALIAEIERRFGIVRDGKGDRSI